MDLAKLRKMLGLPDTAAEAVILEKLEGHFKAASGAVDKVKVHDALLSQLPALGLKVEGEKLVKLSAAPEHEPKADDDEEKKALRKLLAETTLAQGKAKLTKATELSQGYVKALKVPPAMQEELANLFRIADDATVLALSQDQTAIVKKPFDAFASLSKILDAIPAMSAEALAQIGVKPEGGAKGGDELRKKGAEIAARARGRKPEAAKK